MFGKKKRTIDDEISRILCCLENTPISSPEYQNVLLDLEILYKAKALIKPSLGGDTILTTMTGFAGMVLVLIWEERHIISSKIFNSVFRFKF